MFYQWVNAETAAVAQWLEEDPFAKYVARDLVHRLPGIEAPASALASFIIEAKPQVGHSLYQALLEVALENVAWEEIIGAYRKHEEEG